jgi:hypothetical protein
MSPFKTMIADAIRRFPLQSTPEWKKVAAAVRGAKIDRIEADCASISTVDRLFDGQATVILSDSRKLPAQVFGRFDERRAKVDRIVLDD